MAELTEVQKVHDAARALRFVNLVAAFAALCWVVFALTAGPNIDAGPPVLWLVGSLLGCVGILVVLRLCHYATQWFRKQGLKVGLLGPTEASLAAFEKAGVQTKT